MKNEKESYAEKLAKRKKAKRINEMPDINNRGTAVASNSAK